MRIGEVDDSSADRTVNLGTHETWKEVGKAPKGDLSRLGCL